jgi:hypothetical protein
MFDIVKGCGRDFAVNLLEAKGFQGTLADINAPNAGLACHEQRSTYPQGTPRRSVRRAIIKGF